MAETGLNAAEAQKLTKYELVREIVDHRMSQETFVGMDAVYKVVVDENHPFVIRIHPTWNGESKITCVFCCSKTQIVFLAGSPPVQNVLF